MKAVGNKTEKLRVAFLAGTLGQGGAEKQLHFMTRALREAGVTVFVYSLTRGEFYEQKLVEIGCPPTFVGQYSDPLRRLYVVLQHVKNNKPHIIQSAHFFGNLYVAIVGRLTSSISIGAIRGNITMQIQANGLWGKLLLTLPKFIVANSLAAKSQKKFIHKRQINYIPNVIDLSVYDQLTTQEGRSHHNSKIIVATTLRLVKSKKIEDFLTSLHIARKINNSVTGLVIGDGPERQYLESHANALGLFSEGVKFLGRRDDVPAILSQVDIFAFTSLHEGFPNVILEAMAASLPVITTPAGDADIVVEDGVTGFIVPHSSPQEMARRILELAEYQDLRRTMGIRGRERVANHYNFDQLAGNLFAIYRQFAYTQDNQYLLSLLNG